MNSFFHSLPWLFRMAWRDTRSRRARLLLFSLPVVAGVAAMVAIDSFRHSVLGGLDAQVRNQMGSDLTVVARRPYTPEQAALLGSLGDQRSRETALTSMAAFPRSGDAKLVQVIALEGGYPYYGSIKTDPPAAAENFRTGTSVLADETLMLQFDLKPGDKIRLGSQEFSIGGTVLRTPGQLDAFGSFAPKVYLPFRELESTGLLGAGSLAFHKFHFQTGTPQQSMDLAESLKKSWPAENLRIETVETRRKSFEKTLEQVTQYLQLIGFSSLLLGGLGVAAAVSTLVRQNRGTVAILRCLGCSGRQAATVYVLQALALGLAGSSAGALLGVSAQFALTSALAPLFSLSVAPIISWAAVAAGLITGLAVCASFSTLPLLALGKIPALAVFRVHSGDDQTPRQPLSLLLSALFLLAAAWLLSVWQTGSWLNASWFVAGLLAVVGVLILAARLLLGLARLGARKFGSFALRQGIGNLHRPQNRTGLLLVSLGLIAFFVGAILCIQHSLVTRSLVDDAGASSNVVLFDIQSDQLEPVSALLAQHKLPLQHQAPVVTMRIKAIRGIPVAELIREGQEQSLPPWALRREYRSSYRPELSPREKLTSGEWISRFDTSAHPADPIPLSMETGIARDLRIQVGDLIDLDVQGVPMQAKVTSLREVDWRRFEPNFFMVFPPGIFEGAPQTHMIFSRAETSSDAAKLLRASVQQFPNVTVIDLRQILQAVEEVTQKAASIIRFLAGIIALTGLTVLITAVASIRYQRLKETLLLRTLGASRPLIQAILLVEFSILGLAAALAGTLLAMAAAQAALLQLFQAPLALPWLELGLLVFAIPSATVLVGWISSRSFLAHPPLGPLRDAT